MKLVRCPGEFVSSVPSPSICNVSTGFNRLGRSASIHAFIIAGTAY